MAKQPHLNNVIKYILNIKDTYISNPMNTCRFFREGVVVEDEGAEDEGWWGDTKNKAGVCLAEMHPWEHTRRREHALPYISCMAHMITVLVSRDHFWGDDATISF